MKFSKLGSTFLVKRFDREQNKRIHFQSAMALLGKYDGDNYEALNESGIEAHEYFNSFKERLKKREDKND